MKNTLFSFLIALAAISDAQGQCTAPANLQTSYANNVTTFSWTPVNGADSYAIELKQSWDSWTAPEFGDYTTNNVYTLTGIMQSISIDWRVKTICASGESVYQYAPTFTLPCPQPGNLNTTNISMTGATINWTPAPGYNTMVSDFYMSYRQSGGSWISLGHTQATSKVITNLKANTIYEWRVTQTCAYTNSTTVTSSFTTLACNSAGVNTAEWISVFKLGGINRNSGAETGGYINTNTSTNLTLGSGNSARIRVGQNGAFTNKQFKIYIDYNNNSIFEETEVAYGPALINNTGNINFTVNIPSNAPAGSHKMRVIMARNNANITGCMNGHYGETEDYTVTLTTGANKGSLSISPEFAEEEQKINIYPNPVSDNLNIQVPSGVSIINVYDMMGKRIHQQQVTNSTMQINAAQWAATQYILEAVFTDGHRDVIRFVKQ